MSVLSSECSIPSIVKGNYEIGMDPVGGGPMSYEAPHTGDCTPPAGRGRGRGGPCYRYKGGVSPNDHRSSPGEDCRDNGDAPCCVRP
jgi:hypothetical protein